MNSCHMSLMAILVVGSLRSASATSVEPPTLRELLKRSDLVALVRIVDARPVSVPNQPPLRCGVHYSAEIIEVFDGSPASSTDFFAPTVHNEIPGEGLLLGREDLIAPSAAPDFHSPFTNDCGTPRPPYLKEHF